MGEEPNGVTTNNAGNESPAPENHANDEDDPFAFIFELAYISPSQEELLSRMPFVGEYDDVTSPVSSDITVDHSPTEGSSLPPSGNHRCAVNGAVDVGSGTHGLVDSSGDSEIVDSGADSEIGVLTEEVGVVEISGGGRGDVSDIGESSAKKSELLEVVGAGRG